LILWHPLHMATGFVESPNSKYIAKPFSAIAAKYTPFSDLPRKVRTSSILHSASSIGDLTTLYLPSSKENLQK
jgi:hypothetical protein